MKPLILASTSFRRQELLKWTGIPFEIAKPDFEERLLTRESFKSTAQYVEALSYGKALSIIDQFPESIILAGDTMVDFRGRVIGKPVDLDDARKILHALSGNTHYVYSGLAVIDAKTEKYILASVQSAVTFKKLNDDQIEKYIQTGEPMGKAGAYGIQSGAMSFVEKIEGSMTNVIGLPLTKTVQLLSEFGVKSSVNIKHTIQKYLSVDD
jgi:septum formation protein